MDIALNCAHEQRCESPGYLFLKELGEKSVSIHKSDAARMLYTHTKDSLWKKVTFLTSSGVKRYKTAGNSVSKEKAYLFFLLEGYILNAALHELSEDSFELTAVSEQST